MITNTLKLFCLFFLITFSLTACAQDDQPDGNTEFYESLIQLHRFGGLATFEPLPKGLADYVNSKKESVIDFSKPIEESQKDKILNEIINKLNNTIKRNDFPPKKWTRG